jgi:hypothetical protein
LSLWASSDPRKFPLILLQAKAVSFRVKGNLNGGLKFPLILLQAKAVSRKGKDCLATNVFRLFPLILLQAKAVSF